MTYPLDSTPRADGYRMPLDAGFLNAPIHGVMVHYLRKTYLQMLRLQFRSLSL